MGSIYPRTSFICHIDTFITLTHSSH